MMQYYRCKCGETGHWTTDHPADCDGCGKCGTTFARHPEDHKLRVPHTWKPQFSADTGLPDRPYCTRCHKRGDKPTGNEVAA